MYDDSRENKIKRRWRRRRRRKEFHLYAVSLTARWVLVCMYCDCCGMLARYGWKELRIVCCLSIRKIRRSLSRTYRQTQQRKTDPTTYQQNIIIPKPKHISEHKNCNLLYMRLDWAAWSEWVCIQYSLILLFLFLFPNNFFFHSKFRQLISAQYVLEN